MTKKIRRIGVFCGAHTGNNPAYVEVAQQLGIAIAEAGIGLVFGGGNVGIMGEVSNAALTQGGEVIGVIPAMLSKKEKASNTLTELHIVNNMRERKTLIATLSDAFIVFPGGIGTLDEFFEVYCLAMLGVHHKPCAILNVEHYFDSMLDFIKTARHAGFVDSLTHNMLIVEDSPHELLKKIISYQSPIKDIHFVEESEVVAS